MMPRHEESAPANMRAAALWYAKNGIPIFPLHYPVDGGCSCRNPDCGKFTGKHPLTQHGFKDATTELAQVTAWWRQWPDANIGMPTGAVTKRIVLDSDPRNGGPEDREEIIRRYGPIPDGAAEVGTGGGGRHTHFGWDGGPVPKTLAAGIDLKGDGGYVVLPPSLHCSGERYLLDGADIKVLLNPAPAPEWLKIAIAAAQSNGHAKAKPAQAGERWPEGERNNRLTSVAGTMRKRGLSLEAIQAALLEENRLRCEPPLPEAEVRRIAESVSQYKPGSEGAGASAHSPRAEAAEDWPKPEPMQDELPPVEAFSEDLLPQSFRPLVADVTERMQVPMDFPATVAVLSLAGAVNRRVTIQPKANDTSWIVVPNLWGGIVAPPGLMKSPVIQAVTHPLNFIQTKWRQEHEEALRQYALAKEEYELRRTAWKEQYKANTKSGKAAPARPEDEPEQPALRRLIVNDATFEALHETMSENPAGVLLVRDELTGLLSRLDQEQFGTERAFYLQAWNGDTGHTTDRIGRGTIHVPHCCLSILGGIQPGRLRSYLADALKDGPSNDGLIQRFQLLVWPDPPADWRYIDRKPNAAHEEIASQVFRALAQLDSDNPLVFRFDTEAQQLFVAWLTELESKLRSGQLHSALVSHLSKYRSLMPALALLFELADRAAGGSVSFVGSTPGESQNLWVSLEHARQAAAWCDYLESHARRVYSCIVTPQIRAARELAAHIKQRHVTNQEGGVDWFATRDVYRKGWTGLDSPEAARQAAGVLQDAHWLRELPSKSGVDGGRPSNRWAVNPGVWR